MNVVHLATTDRGGAAVAARRLHQGLLHLGVGSRMLVVTRTSAVESIDTIEPTANGLIGRIRRRIDRSRFAREWRAYAASQPSGQSYVTDDRVPGLHDLVAKLPEADVYHLHWVTGLVDPLPFFSQLRPDVPLVWTLHDMNTFTGGCHYSAGCDAFLKACGCCPQLGSHAIDDHTARSHARKRRAYASLRPPTTRIVTPSQWLASEARQSSLLGRLQVEVIPYGLDVNVFSPKPRVIARQVLGLPADGPIIGFIADHVDLRLKGLDLLYRALEELNGIPNLTVAVIGGGFKPIPGGARVAWLGRVEDERLMALALSAMDVFVVPSRADNLPNVMLEAMACGTPVVGFATGGIPDAVRPDETGLLAPAGDAPALGKALATILNDEPLRRRLAEGCRRAAEAEYALDVQATRYRDLYSRLISAAGDSSRSADTR